MVNTLQRPSATHVFGQREALWRLHPLVLVSTGSSLWSKHGLFVHMETIPQGMLFRVKKWFTNLQDKFYWESWELHDPKLHGTCRIGNIYRKPHSFGSEKQGFQKIFPSSNLLIQKFRASGWGRVSRAGE